MKKSKLFVTIFRLYKVSRCFFSPKWKTTEEEAWWVILKNGYGSWWFHSSKRDCATCFAISKVFNYESMHVKMLNHMECSEKSRNIWIKPEIYANPKNHNIYVWFHWIHRFYSHAQSMLYVVYMNTSCTTSTTIFWFINGIIRLINQGSGLDRSSGSSPSPAVNFFLKFN